MSTTTTGETGATIIPFRSRDVSPGRDIRQRAATETREARRKQWRTAKTRTNFYLSLLMLVRNAEDAAKCGVDAAAPYAQLDEWSLLKQYREALAEQLLAPAPTLADLNWKRTVRPVHLPLDHATLNRVLDADEAWLAANKPPGRKRGPKGGPRGDVQ